MGKFTTARTRQEPVYKGAGDVGIIQLSDLHFGETIDCTMNQYNFDIAAARLAEFAAFKIAMFKAMGIKKVFIALTGDLINSDRRIDENSR